MNHSSKRKCLRGFTLAEVLITLAIIGVVAALSIPGLIADSQEKEYAVALKKAYAELSQALMNIQATEGYVNVGIGGTIAYHQALRDQFSRVMNFSKTGTLYEIFGHANYKYYKSGNSGFITAENGENRAGILADQMLVHFGSIGDCTHYGVNACGSIVVDINAEKAPNMMGKDFYRFHIVKKNDGYFLLPFGADGDTYSPPTTGCQSGSTDMTTSLGCTAKRLLDPNNMP